MADYDNATEAARRRMIAMSGGSYFPAARRFSGALEPSPSGTYFHPERYGSDLSPRQLATAQRNLANVYQQDLQYNRVANPRYQTVQDTGYSSTAGFGSGRASPATTANYLNTYGSTTPEGRFTSQLPSGGSVTLARAPRGFSGGLSEGGAKPYNQNLPLDKYELAGNWWKGYGSYVQPSASGPVTVQGGVAAPTQTNVAGNLLDTLPFASNIRGLGTLAYNAGAALSRQFGGGGSTLSGAAGQGGTAPVQPQSNPAYFAYNPSPAPPRRYFDTY